MISRRTLSVVVSLALAGCSWFQGPEPKQRVVVRTTPKVPNFPTEAEAKLGCLNDPVVWGDSTALIFYPPGSGPYGKTTHGAYLCTQTAELGGYHPAVVAAK